MAAEKIVVATEQRIQLFAEASDDFNPVHLDEGFASKTAYRGRIAHGLLSASFGSAVVGTILPGAGSIYIS
ncbi:MaoC/PaaZ C-terminal domain-containing protein, partial [Mesorhizobium japonicum]